MRKFLLLLISSLWLSVTYGNTTHYIIDTDMGFDDWLAVIYLLKQPVTIDGITIDCQGETRCPEGAYNASRLTHLAKRDVPIALGNSRPLSTYDFPVQLRDYATAMAVPDFLHLKMDRDITKNSAAEMILNSTIQAEKRHDKVVIISIGTATNINDAWKLAVKENKTTLFHQGLGMIYKGGGAFGKVENHHLTNEKIPGNIAIPHIVTTHNTTAEWNIYANAPAMKTLVDANLPITFIPDDATDQVNMTEKSYDDIYNGSHPGSVRRFTANAMMSLVTLQGNWKFISTNLDFWDTATTITALHPNLVTEKFNHVPMEVILSNGNHYATTWVLQQSTHDVSVDYHLNKDLFYRLLLAGIS